MKNTLLTLVFVLINLISYSQLGPLTPVGEYSAVGDVDSLVWKNLNEVERDMYLRCLDECGIHKDSVKWLTLETIDNLIITNQYYNCKVVTKYSGGFGEFVIVNEGSHSLEKPEIVAFITREDGVSMVKIQMYY